MNTNHLNGQRTITFKNLPQRSTCPKCGKSRKKDSFGVRLMNGEAVKKGAKPILRRQSYCTECRHPKS